MPRTITIPDEIYERLERLAISLDLTLEQLLDGWASLAEHAVSEHAVSPQTATPEYTRGDVFRQIGLDEELVAHLLATPIERRNRELRLAVTAMMDERSGRDPLKEPRHLTFEQFFHELGHTDEQIAEAKRQAAAHADV